MKSVQLLLALAASTITTTEAIALHRRQDGSAPRVVGFDLQRNKIRDPVAHDRNRRRRRRSDTVDVNVDNEQTLYFFNASVGTPKQDIRFHLDTGSSDIWVNSPNSTLCGTTSNQCSESGTYYANDSSTYNYVGSWFNISYTDGSGASGDYVTDTFRVGNTSIANLQFGIGYTSTSTDSILGIGYTSNEVQVDRAGKAAYSNLPAKMVSDGLIASNAYSIWLNDLDASTGSILFGGVDQARYSGDLVTLPIQKTAGEYSEFFITLTGLTYGNTTLSDSLALAVLLDTGSSLTYLPSEFTDTIFDDVGAVYEEADGVAFVPCSLAQDSRNLTFKFSDPAEVVVPLADLVIDVLEITGRQLSFNDGTSACMFGLAPTTGTNVLGDSFLRSAYVVFDLSNNGISIAQSNTNTTSSDVVEIGTGNDAVPSATAASNPVAAKSGLPQTATSSQESGATGLTTSDFGPITATIAALLIAFAVNLA